MSLTIAQKIALSIGILGFVATGGTQLTDIFAPLGSMAPIVVKEIVSLAGFATGVLGIVLTFLTGQGSQISAVQAMAGVEKIIVNAQANPTLATMAVDQTQNKITPLPAAAAAVQATAKAATQ